MISMGDSNEGLAAAGLSKAGEIYEREITGKLL